MHHGSTCCRFCCRELSFCFHLMHSISLSDPFPTWIIDSLTESPILCPGCHTTGILNYAIHLLALWTSEHLSLSQQAFSFFLSLEKKTILDFYRNSFPKILAGFPKKILGFPKCLPSFLKCLPSFPKAYLVSQGKKGQMVSWTRHFRFFCKLEGELQILRTWCLRICARVDIREIKN